MKTDQCHIPETVSYSNCIVKKNEKLCLSSATHASVGDDLKQINFLLQQLHLSLQ